MNTLRDRTKTFALRVSSRSNAEMISKFETALQELDETTYWLELIIESGIMRAQRLAPLIAEANELIAILVASVRTIKRRRR
jgi:four helix bundle protein